MERKTAAKTKVVRKPALISAIEIATNKTAFTQNGAISNKSTLNAMLDFFARGGAMRNCSEQEITSLFGKAYAENPNLAMKALFHFRDVRGGMGERRLFRVILSYLADNYKVSFLKNLRLIPFYGRWDDIVALLENQNVKNHVLDFIKEQFTDDCTSNEKSISLLAKWLPSENTSSPKTRALAKIVRSSLGMSSKQYRQTLSKLRDKINIVENKMCAREWTNIDYSAVPSKASMIYAKAFGRHDSVGYSKYMEDVKAGVKKINASTLFPYEIVRSVQSMSGDERTLDAQWNALPDYAEGSTENGIVVADVSGSMSGLPMQMSISLAIYFAERNKGAFKDYFITFSAKPTLQKVVGANITEKVKNLEDAQWDMNTDLQAVFDLILTSAKNQKLKSKDIPSTIYIVSDMQFDHACHNRTNFEVIKDKFKAAKLTMPKLVFWNVQAANQDYPVTEKQTGAALFSGASPCVIKQVLTGKKFTPVDMMLSALNSDRYSEIVA